MTGLLFALLLITAGLYWRFRRHKPARAEFSAYWLKNILPEHEDEQSKRR
jgi:cbb3-type cytochrome oxidase subunit 3